MSDTGNGRTSIAEELQRLNIGADAADFVLAYAFDRLVHSVDALRNEIKADRESREETERARTSSERARTLANFTLAGAIIVALIAAIAGRAFL